MNCSKLQWKTVVRETHYGVWHELNVGLNNFSSILLREPICLRKLHFDNINPNPTKTHIEYVNKLYHDENPCPQKGECGWLIDVSGFGWSEPLDETFDLKRGIKNPPILEINSLEEAKIIAQKRIMKHVQRFTHKLITANKNK